MSHTEGNLLLPRAFVAVLALTIGIGSSAYAEYTVRTIHLPSGFAPASPVYNNTYDHLYVRSWGQACVAAIDVATATVDTVVNLGAYPHVGGVWCDEARDLLYCTSGYDFESWLSVIDCATNIVVRAIRVGRTPRGIAGDANSGRVFIAYWDQPGGVGVYDPVAETLIARVTTGEVAAEVYLNERAGKLYSYMNPRRVTNVIDCSTLVNKGRILPGVGETGCYVSPYNQKLYRGALYIYVVDGTTDSVRAVHEVDGVWDSFVHNPRHDVVFAGAPQHSTVAVLDGQSDSMLRQFSLPSGGDFAAYCMACDSSRDRVLIGSSIARTVYVLTGSGDSLQDAIALPGRPTSMLLTSDGTLCVLSGDESQVSICYPPSALEEVAATVDAPRECAATLGFSSRTMLVRWPVRIVDILGRTARTGGPGEVSLGGLRPGVYHIIVEGPLRQGGRVVIVSN